MYVGCTFTFGPTGFDNPTLKINQQKSLTKFIRDFIQGKISPLRFWWSSIPFAHFDNDFVCTIGVRRRLQAGRVFNGRQAVRGFNWRWSTISRSRCFFIVSAISAEMKTHRMNSWTIWNAQRLFVDIRSGFYEFYLCRTPSMSKKGDYLLILIFFRRVGKKKNFKIEKPGRLRSWTGRSTVSIHRSNSIRHGQAFRSPFNRKFFIKRKIITIIKARKLVERRTVSEQDRSFSKRWCT